MEHQRFNYELYNFKKKCFIIYTLSVIISFLTGFKISDSIYNLEQNCTNIIFTFIFVQFCSKL